MTIYLTKKQQETISAVFDLAKANKVWPTFKEVETHLGLLGSTAPGRVISLEKKRLVEVLNSFPKRIKLTDKALKLAEASSRG